MGPSLLLFIGSLVLFVKVPTKRGGVVLVWGVVIYNLIVINLSLEVTFRQMVFGMEGGGQGLVLV